MSKKKKEPVQYIKVGNARISLDELVEQVNLADKKYGIRLKHPEIWADPHNYLQIVSARADMNLAALICVINGINTEEYFESTETGTICNPINVTDPLFTEESIFDWEGNNETFHMNSLEFRCKFVTLVLCSLLGRIDKVVERESIYKYRYTHSIDERRILLTKKIVNECYLFTRLMLKPGAKYQNIILKMHEHVSYSRKRYDYRELQRLFNGHVINTRSSMQSNPFRERFCEDDMAIYQTLKIAYMAATNNTNLDVIPNFKHIEHATVKHDLIKLIEDLGANIIKQCRGNKYAPMFRAFIGARPSIWSSYYEEACENSAIKMGIIALTYAKFVYNDKTMDKFVSKMLKPGK